jgi:EmrB/QacA subfamily drug resistance transporter
MKAAVIPSATRPVVRQLEEADARRRWLLLAVVSSAQFLAAFDLWVVTIALPTLQREFAPAALSDVAWILNVYTIVLAAFLAPSGRFADTLGRKRAFLVGMGVFGLASVGCAMATTLPVMIAWRSVQALSAAVVLPTSLGLALPAFPPHQRTSAIGIWAAVGAIAAGGGPVLGGLLIQASWRWIFLINVPIVLVAIVAGSLLLPRDPIVRGGVRFDGIGLMLFLGAMGLVCAGLIEASTWPAVVTWTALTVGAVATAAFVVHALRHPEPVLPPRLFRSRRFTMSAVGLFTYYAGFTVNLLGLTLLLTEGMHLSVLEAALGLIPGPLSAGVASPFSGRVVARIGARRTMLLGAGLFALAGLWPLLSFGSAPSYISTILPALVFWGVANACIQPTLFAGADAAPKDDLALAAAVLASARQVGSALGVALLVGVTGASGLSTFQSAWVIVLASALLTAAVGVFGRHSRPADRAGCVANHGRHTRPNAHRVSGAGNTSRGG